MYQKIYLKNIKITKNVFKFVCSFFLTKNVSLINPLFWH